MPFDAERVFWCRPDLVAKLLAFLDTNSTICLAQLTNLNTAHGRALWNLLIRRQLCVRREEVTSPDRWDNEKEFVQARILVMDLVNILKLKKEASLLQLDLLNFICERFSASPIANTDFVEMHLASSHPSSHTLSPFGLPALGSS